MFSILPPPLHETAEGARLFFRNQFGTSLRIEEPPFPNATYRPTLSGVTRDFHLLCIEVSDTAYTNSLDAFVLDCKLHVRPVKLIVAIPKNDGGDPNFKLNLRRARENGVGVVEVEPDGSGSVLHEPLSLSLTGLRPYDPREFPARYREAMRAAYNTFTGGDPLKGCARVYDEIEALCRAVGQKAVKRKCFGDMKKTSSFNFETEPWATVVTFLDRNLDRKLAACPDLKPALLARVLGVTPHRNEAGHRPRNTRGLIRRDRELRTRFEHASDLFRDLIAASRGLAL